MDSVVTYKHGPVVKIVAIDQLGILFASLGAAIQFRYIRSVQMLIPFTCSRCRYRRIVKSLF